MYDLHEVLSYMLYWSQLRLHAQHKGREHVFTLHDRFEASVATTGNQSHNYVNISSHGIKYFFAMSLVFPIFGLLLLLSYTKGARLQIRSYMNDSDNFPTLAALFWIGQTFTILVIVLDILAIIEHKTPHMNIDTLENYQCAILIVNLAIEFCFWFFAIVVVLLLSVTHYINDEYRVQKIYIVQLFCIFCSPIFCISAIKHQEARLWLFLMGFSPPLWAAFSHLGYVIGGWISYEDRSIAVLILYLFSFVFLYSSLQSAYQSIFDLRKYTYVKPGHKYARCQLQIPKYTEEISFECEMKKHVDLCNETGFNYNVLLLMVIPWLLLNGIIIIMG